MKYLYEFESQMLTKGIPLEHITMPYVYRIALPARESNGNIDTNRAREIEAKVEEFLNDYVDEWQALLLSFNENSLILLIQTNDDSLDQTLLKLSTDAKILQKLTSEEFNELLDDFNRTNGHSL